jgi:hypothetical protein
VRNNGLEPIGVAPETELYAVKVLGSTGSGSWSAVADDVAAAHAAGVLVVSAAGNSGCCNTVIYPAKYPGSMAVAAVDRYDVRASFSSTGPDVDVTAPGVSGRSSVPTGTCALCDPTGYKTLSGTSMATPHGTLLMSRGWNNVDAWSLINGTVRDLGDPGFDELYRLRSDERPRGGGRDASAAASAAAERRDASTSPPRRDASTWPPTGTIGQPRAWIYVDLRTQCQTWARPARGGPRR